MDKVEEVAEAIRLHTTDAHWTPEGLARAALEAMRKPTEAMKEAGFQAGYLGDGEWEYAHPTEAYQAMIDAALSGKE